MAMTFGLFEYVEVIKMDHSTRTLHYAWEPTMAVRQGTRVVSEREPGMVWRSDVVKHHRSKNRSLAREGQARKVDSQPFAQCPATSLAPARHMSRPHPHIPPQWLQRSYLLLGYHFWLGGHWHRTKRCNSRQSYLPPSILLYRCLLYFQVGIYCTTI